MRFTATLMLSALIAAGFHPAEARTLLVPQQYPAINTALGHAKTGDTVLVSPNTTNSGVYSEAVIVSTPGVTLQGCGNPIIDGANVTPGAYGTYGIDILTSRVTVSGFTIRNFVSTDFSPAAAINVGDYDSTGTFFLSGGNITISGNTLTNDDYGIYISGYSSDGAYLSGYQVIGNTITGGNASISGLGGGYGGASITGAQALVAGNRITGNNSDGLDISGEGFTVTGNEIGGNALIGLNVSVSTYNPAVNSPAAPNPAPTVVAFNTLSGNQSGGVSVTGTTTVLGNAVTGNGHYGVLLAGADYSLITGNQITGTLSSDSGLGQGQGVYGEYNGGGGITVSYNQISRNAGGGIYFFSISGSLILGNTIIGNKGIGIFLFPYTYHGAFPPDTVTLNVAQGNSGFDAVDLVSASPTIPIPLLGGSAFGGGLTTANVWTRNIFGVTDPVGLGK